MTSLLAPTRELLALAEEVRGYDEIRTRREARVAAAIGVFGGPGSGPQKHADGPVQASPLGVPSFPLMTADHHVSPEIAVALGESSKLFDRAMRVAVPSLGERSADRVPYSGADRQAMKEAAVRAVGARMAADPKFAQWAERNAVVVDKAAAQRQMEHPRGVDAQAQVMAQAYVDRWAFSSADHDPKAWAMQEVAAEVFGGKADASSALVTDWQRREVKDEIALSGPAIESYLRATYAETQDTLRGVDSLVLTRGFGTEDRPGVVAGTPVERGADGGVVSNGVTAEVTSNPLSSWSTDFRVAQSFAVQSSLDKGGVLKEGVYPAVAVNVVPADRIFSLPSTGPGCLSESELVVLGGAPFQSGIIPQAPGVTAWSKAVAAVGSRRLVNIDTPPNDDWAKRTPDSMDEIAKLAEAEAADPTTASVMALRRALGADGYVTTADPTATPVRRLREALRVSQFGGPGSGPQGGESHPHAGAGKGKSNDKADKPKADKADKAEKSGGGKADMWKFTGTGTEKDPIVTPNVNVAAQALSEGKYVQLNQPDEVATLLDRMKEMVDEAKVKGAEAPSFDLCRVSVADTNVFCADAFVEKRVEMPQLSGKPIPGSPADSMEKDAQGYVRLGEDFVKSLRDQGIKVETKDVLASHLRASQRELDGAKVAKMANKIEAGKFDPSTGRTIFATRDGYILDGHHRWAATVGAKFETGKDLTLPVNVLDMSIVDALNAAKSYTENMGLPPQGHGEFTTTLSVEMFGGEGSGPQGPRTEEQKAARRESIARNKIERAKGTGKMFCPKGVVTAKQAAQQASQALPAKAAEEKARADKWVKDNPEGGRRGVPPEVHSWHGSGNENFVGRKFLSDNPREVRAAKVAATRTFTKALNRFGGEISPGGAARISGMLDEVAKEPKMQAAVERFGPVGAIVPLGSLSDALAGAIYVGRMDTIGINVSDKQIANQMYLDERTPAFGRNLVGNGAMSANFRHEFGHHVDTQLEAKEPEVHERIRMMIVNLRSAEFAAVSAYAAGQVSAGMSQATQRSEAFAETFSAVTHPQYDRESFPPSLHPLLAEFEGLVT